MTQSHRLLSAAFVLALGSLPRLAAVQTSDPEALQRRLKSGDIIAIVATDGTEVRGRLERLDQSTIEALPITPGATPNEYKIDKTPTRVAIDQVVAINLVDPLGANPRPVFERRDSFGTLRARVRTGQVIKVTERSGPNFAACGGSRRPRDQYQAGESSRSACHDGRRLAPSHLRQSKDRAPGADRTVRSRAQLLQPC
jgi:hypothetical protein